MKLARCSHKALATAVAVLLLYTNLASIVSVQAADPDPLVDVSPSANNTFVFRDVYKNGATTTTEGGIRAALNITDFPALTYVDFSTMRLFAILQDQSWMVGVHFWALCFTM
jgi:hypothetical protein